MVFEILLKSISGHCDIKASFTYLSGLVRLEFKLLEIDKFHCFSANLNTYVISYIRNEDNSTTYKDWVYVTSTKVFVQGITMPFLGKLELMIGTKQSILLGCIIYS